MESSFVATEIDGFVTEMIQLQNANELVFLGFCLPL